MNNNLHVMSIRGSGYLNLKLVNITLENGKVYLGGPNRAGKSAILSLIQLMKGKAYLPEMPIKEGEKEGKFEIKLADEDRNVRYIVKYSFQEKGSYLTMEDAEGEEAGLTLLKTFLSPCMNPWEFFRDGTAKGLGATERHKKTVDIVQELMVFHFDIDEFMERMGFSGKPKIEKIKEQSGDPLTFLKSLDLCLMENRKAWKENRTKLAGSIKQLGEDVPIEKRNVEEKDIGDLFKKQEALQTEINAHYAAVRGTSLIEGNIQETLEEIQAAEVTLNALKAKLEKQQAELGGLREQNAKLRKEEELENELAKLKAESDSINEDNTLARKAADLRSYEEKAEEMDETIRVKDREIDAVREERITVLETADMPIKGITIEDGRIYKNGIPFGQDSEEEGLTDAFEFGLAKFEKMAPECPKLKTMIIPNASLIGKKATAHLLGLAEKHGIQIILELVMDKAEKGVIFVEDGIALSKDD